jgi:hypothetical protein
MSTLRVSTIQDTAGSNSSTPAAIANGICKAWVNFNGTGTVAIRAQYNVSSITDNGAGDFTVNFTNALADANYSVNMTASITSSGIAPCVSNVLTTTTPTSSLVRMIVDRANIGPTDPVYTNVAIFR